MHFRKLLSTALLATTPVAGQQFRAIPGQGSLSMPEHATYAEAAQFVADKAAPAILKKHPGDAGILPEVRAQDMELFKNIEAKDGGKRVYDDTFAECVKGSSVASAIPYNGVPVPVVAMMIEQQMVYKLPGAVEYKPWQEQGNGSWQEKCGKAATNTEQAAKYYEESAKGAPGKQDGLRRRDPAAAPSTATRGK